MFYVALRTTNNINFTLELYSNLYVLLHTLYAVFRLRYGCECNSVYVAVCVSEEMFWLNIKCLCFVNV